jgi:hypothetical protein
MKKSIAMLFAALLASSLSFADSSHDNGNGNDDCVLGGNCSSGSTVGPQGPTGQNGINGQTGVNGKDGVDGKDGKDGKDATTSYHGADLNADIAVRLFDTRYVQGQVFTVYTFGQRQGQDVFGNGQNSSYGARIVIKLGSSYEERRLDAQQKEIDSLKAALLTSKHK